MDDMMMIHYLAFLVAQTVLNLPLIQDTWV